MSELIYFDNSATTQTAPEVLEVMLPFFCELYGNASSMHSFGGRIGSHIKKARQSVADLIGAEPDEIIFTSCGTESNNTALWSALRTQPNKRHIVTSGVEHPAINSNMIFLKKAGYEITTLGVDSKGNLSLDELKKALRDNTALVTIMWANNETGVIFPVEEIAEFCHERGILFHTDAVQYVGKLPLNLKNSKIDMLSFSGHKIYAPKGIGVLYARKKMRFAPLIIGGHQERGRRGGTENVPYIVGLGRAAELIMETMKNETKRIRKMRDKLEKNIIEKIPHSIVNGDPAHRLPNISNISFEFIEGESILLHLSNAGICASSGSACTSGSLEPSHVLRAMEVPFTAAHGSIRFSLSHYNTEKEIDFVLEKLPNIIDKLRKISPFWKDGKPVSTELLTHCDDNTCQVCL